MEFSIHLNNVTAENSSIYQISIFYFHFHIEYRFTDRSTCAPDYWGALLYFKCIDDVILRNRFEFEFFFIVYLPFKQENFQNIDG